VVGGPTFAELDGLRLDGAVVLNVACYTGVTRTFFEDDHRAGVLRQLEVPFDESFCLAILRSGVVGYTAYLCPRPAGPELSTDLAALLADGLSLGAARRRDYDKTVLGFLGFGEERMVLGPVADGTELRAGRDPVRDMMLEGATGGVLFGDPACVPFAARDAEAPVQIEMEAAEGGFRIRARATTRALYQHCADPTAKWGKTMAMKVHARVPLGDSLVEDVVVDSVRVGREVLPSRALWAIEDDRGARFLQLKINFPRRDRWAGELVVAARVLATRDPDRARSRGGEVQRAPVVSQDLRSREVQDFMLERAAARDVSRPALQAALDASAAEVGVAGVEAGALDRLAAFGSEGLRATCVLLEVGHAHYRTWKLLEATWTPGDEQHLVALATFEDLPNFASWQVLEGLGVADTPAVRAYLTERLSTEQDPGLFMATAKGLAHLGAREAAAAIGDRVLLFLDGWSGVERHLVEALAELGGPVAVERLERIARDPRSSSVESALRALDGLDPEAATRARAARR
jgi:hypothetical protein